MALTSGSLMERPEPYWLPLELARGTIVQVRNQLSDWELIGLAVPSAVYTKLAVAVERFSRAAVEKEDTAVSAGYTEVALRAALDAADLLAAAYADQALAQRRRNGEKQSLVSRRRPRPDSLGSPRVATVPADVQRRRDADLLARHGNHRGQLFVDHQ